MALALQMNTAYLSSDNDAMKANYNRIKGYSPL